jgi:hypothetical protein
MSVGCFLILGFGREDLLREEVFGSEDADSLLRSELG